ncbi:T9SS type A sorting domain-containing protein, partial [Cytophaga aurantiaca]|uniref:T9SS type A sorting domain-containing protein n=1 Tax=Cytophaga aurantiaca TaxID=29530 RepID=UPI0004779BB6
KTNQTITFGALASKVVGDPNFTLTATASSGLTVTYTSSNPAVATVTSAGVVTIVGAGSTVITASQAGNATYNAAPSVTQTLTVNNSTSTSNMKVASGSAIVVNNSGTTDIGAALINTPTSSYTFTISNVGTSNLIISTITASSGFTATQIFPSGAISPNASVTFTVTGTPNDASAPRLGTVSILSNDVNSLFTINVSARVGTATGVTTTLSASDIELFPNPTVTGYSNLEFNGAFDDVIVTIYTADGSKAVVQNFSSVVETSRQLDVQALPSGVYFVEVATAQGKLVKRLIKQ